MSNFSYKDAKGNLVQIPVRYGDMNRQVAQVMKKNSENTIPSAPFIACWIKDVEYDRARIQDPTFVSKVNVRERDIASNEYINSQGANYTIERIMPTPYLVTFVADLWTTNTDQKLQIWEQLAIWFHPSLELQTTDNYIDWTSISVLTLKNQKFSSRQIPQGVEQDIDIMNMEFEAPIWISPPAKVKKLGIITQIINSIFTPDQETIADLALTPGAILPPISENSIQVIVTPGNYDLLVLNNVASLVTNAVTSDPQDVALSQNSASWLNLLDLYPGKFRAGLSQIRLKKPDDNEIVAYISLDPNDEKKMALSFDRDTIPSDILIDSQGRVDTDPLFNSGSARGTIDAIINPETYKPTPVAGTRYLILEDLNINDQYGELGYDGPDAWKNQDNSDPQVHANDIIEWNGIQWNVIFNSTTTSSVIYITNSYTGIQYKWENGSWSKSFEGIYEKGLWRLIL